MNLQPIQEALDSYSDYQMKARRQAAAEGRPCRISCAKGCAACCSEPLFLYEPEVLLMLAALTAEQLDYVRERTVAWLAKAEWLDKEPGNHLVNAFKYRAHEMVCPFLRNNLCIAYRQRPFGCRAHLAKGPRSGCEDLALRPQQTFWFMPELTAEMRRRLEGAMHTALGGELDKPLTVNGGHLGFLLAKHFELGEVKIK